MSVVDVYQRESCKLELIYDRKQKTFGLHIHTILKDMYILGQAIGNYVVS